MKKQLLYCIALAIASVFIWTQCQTPSDPTSSSNSNTNTINSPFRNLNSDSASYVGIQVCQSCHQDIHASYSQTGMGQSFGEATASRSQATFGEEALVYDEKNKLYYRPFLKNDSIYIQEYRLRGKDTIHSRVQKIDYIIGSGHHTNSHLYLRNGYLYQAPITYYTQEKKWDLAPGFEEENQRFDRPIASECLTCHNHFPTPIEGSYNKYEQIPLGIECERCHGAGSLHVTEKLAGKLVDTSKHIDYSITNPRHLSIEQQMDICQRCHLQGVAVLNEGHNFYEYRPGTDLGDVMQVFLPRFSNSHERFIMASQADRLRLSPCYLESKQLSCISCHNPHHDVHDTDKNNYNSSCINCHNPQTTLSQLTDCSIPTQERESEEKGCVGCHMRRSGSIDIPHITITDHNISRATAIEKPILADDETEEIAQFLGLENLTNPNSSHLDQARGYLALYEKFMQDAYVLDSAWMHLQASTQSEDQKFNTFIHYHFSKKDYLAITNLVSKNNSKTIDDAWTAYRIGQAYYQRQDLENAYTFFEQATDQMPYQLDFQEKKGLTEARLQKNEEARKTFEWILGEDHLRASVWMNLGVLEAQVGNNNRALECYEKAFGLNPNYEAARINYAQLCAKIGRIADAKKSLQELLFVNPNNPQAIQLLMQL